MQTGTLGVIADLDKCVGQFTQFFDSFHIGCTHVGCRDDAQFAAVLREGGQLIHNEAQAAPLDKRNQHINAVAGHDFLFEFGEHLWFVYCAGKERALCNRCFRAYNLSLFIERKHTVFLIKKRKKLLRALCN